MHLHNPSSITTKRALDAEWPLELNTHTPWCYRDNAMENDGTNSDYITLYLEHYTHCHDGENEGSGKLIDDEER